MRIHCTIILCLAVLSSALDIHIDKAKFEEAIKYRKDGANGRLLENIILEMLEQLRNLMQTGSDTFPILDPLSLGTFRVDGEAIGMPGAFVELNDMTVANLSTFVVDNLKLKVKGIIFQTYTITFDGYIPELNIDTSSYNMLLHVFGAAIFGNGDMTLKITEPRVKGVIEASLKTNNGLFLNLDSCSIEVSLKAFEPVITGFWDNETSSAFVSRFLTTLIPELMEFFEVEINNFISFVVQTIGNEILRNLDLIDIIRP